MQNWPTLPDVVVIGAGPVGCVSALAFAQQGARVLLLEAQPQAVQRLAGEWLHPLGTAILQGLDAWPVLPAADHAIGHGFAVFPDDGDTPITLQYPGSATGLICEHSVLVAALRDIVLAHAGISFLCGARVTRIVGQRLHFTAAEYGESCVVAPLIVGASGRSSQLAQWLPSPPQRTVISSMAGVLLEHVELPYEGFGHLLLGGPGPVFLYRIGLQRVRVCLDVPAHQSLPHDTAAYLWQTYSPVFPEALRPALRHALETRPLRWAANPLRPRLQYGRDGFALVGDAVGHSHPLTAVGMTLGFMDAECLARSSSFADYRSERTVYSQVPALVAALLYDVFTQHDAGAVALRHAIYRMWRHSPAMKRRTIRLLSGEATGLMDFGRPFLQAMALAAERTLRGTTATGDWRHTAHVLTYCGTWLQRCLAQVYPGSPGLPLLRATPPRSHPARHPTPAAGNVDGAAALRRAVRYLLSQQHTDGAWEGEVVWCPMLAAQYVLTCFLTSTTLLQGQPQALLQYFAVTRLPSGLWGLGEQTQPYLFVTTLVYVAARLLGVEKDDPLLAAASQFIRREGGVSAIPTWGKFWLAMLNLYDWHGLNPILPEAWLLPRWLPLHPANFYCHTRLIYLAMAAIYGRKFQAPLTPLLSALRAELYTCAYDTVDFRTARSSLRAQEVYIPPPLACRVVWRLGAAYERWHIAAVRSQALAELTEHIRFDLQSTDYACLSPVNGLLSMIALWLQDPTDPDWRQAMARFPVWMWQDEEQGLRVAGALSTTWDTALAMQALEAARPHVEVTPSLHRARQFLTSQQIRTSLPGARRFFRLDPQGGFCFARAWHGWPVSDCTAEALLALLEPSADTWTPEAAVAAVQFILQRQNADGGFGSYERRHTTSTLEWLNPAEMFADSMTEHSYVECTAACLQALQIFQRRYPSLLVRESTVACTRGGTWLRQQQRADGLWPGTWGIHLIYGTLFGVRGLLATGALPGDPALRRAVQQLLRLQQPDGGWGEHFQGCLSNRYVPHQHSQVIHTAWAMLALLATDTSAWEALERGAQFLITSQCTHGDWPKQDPAGVFFHTAPLDYTLYRSYFPLWALGLYETWRLARLGTD